MQWLIKEIGQDNAQYKVMEFHAATIVRMGIDGRMSLCQYSSKTRAKTSLIDPDQVMMSYMWQRAKEAFPTKTSQLLCA